MRSRKIFAGALVAATTLGTVGVAAAAPPGLPGENPNPNAVVIPVDCEGLDPFVIWIPNTNGNVTGGAGAVGHPINSDVNVGVQKRPGQGAAFERAILCETPIGPVYVMPTGQDRR